ncbi:MAG TPA: hypothetical protein PK388_05740 [Kiritimatiellia bacterium]|nr:hypothetical protein [Kiritimatiellia bacterium]
MKFRIALWIGLSLAMLFGIGARFSSAAEASATGAFVRLSDAQIEQTYDMLADHHARRLEAQGVKLPQLRRADGRYTQAALTLVRLAQGYPDAEPVTKTELTAFIRQYHPQANDVQQARHLAAQQGWYIVSGTRNDDGAADVPAGAYKLVSLENAYPGFRQDRRTDALGSDDWEQLKALYDHRCACCGSREGEPNLRWPETMTRLQKGHMDPAKPIEPGNVIPQCDACNEAARDFWIFDSRGRVVGIASPTVVERCPEELQRRIYERLEKKYSSPPADGREGN